MTTTKTFGVGWKKKLQDANIDVELSFMVEFKYIQKDSAVIIEMKLYLEFRINELNINNKMIAWSNKNISKFWKMFGSKSLKKN